MPNGFIGSREGWEALEAPLRALDDDLEAFSRRRGRELERNYHGWPNRRLLWGRPVQRLIEIARCSEDGDEWSLSICAFEDRDGERFVRWQVIREKRAFASLAGELPALLGEAAAEVDRWHSEDLEHAGPVSAP